MTDFLNILFDNTDKISAVTILVIVVIVLVYSVKYLHKEVAECNKARIRDSKEHAILIENMIEIVKENKQILSEMKGLSDHILMLEKLIISK